MLVEIFLFIFVIACLQWYKFFFTETWGLKGAKGPFPWPFLGNMPKFRTITNVFEALDDLLKKFGKTVITSVLWNITIFTLDCDFIEFIVTSPKTINKGFVYKFVHKWLGTGLLTSGGSKWQKRRKLITPAYHFQILENFFEVFDRNGKILMEKLRAQASKDEEFNIYPCINLYTLDIICESAMGTKVNAQNNSESEYATAVKEMTRIVLERSFKLFKFFDTTFAFTKDYKIEKDSLKVLHNYTLNVIKSRRQELLLNKESNNTEQKKREAFLDILLKCTVDGEPLSDEDIREEVDTFMFEGHDTVSAGISFCLYAIANHPEIQKHLYDEQKEIFASDPERSTTLADLQEMKYLDLVIKESLRLYPSVPLMTREVQEDVEYKNMKIKKGTQLSISPLLLHRDPDLYPDPFKFDPERFLPEKQSERHTFAYIPFSAGFRNCIGQRFAIYEMKTTLSKIIRNFELVASEKDNDIKLKSSVVLATENGIILKLRNR